MTCYMICFIVIVCLRSRVALIGISVSSFFIISKLYPGPGRKKWYLSGIVLSGFLLMFFTKKDSTLGRFFIWKIAMQVWSTNWVKGIGYGKFNFHFNHAQAAYFQSHDVYSNEAMLAKDGYYAFNDWLQYSIEFGIAGLALALLMAIGLIYMYLKQLKRSTPNNNTLLLALLLPLLVATIVSYPLHRWYFQCIGICVMMLLLINTLPFSVNYTRACGFISVGLTMFIFLLCQFIGYQKQAAFSEANALWNEGASSEAINKLNILNKESPGNFLFTKKLASWLIAVKRPEDGIHFLEMQHELECSQKFHAFLGNLYAENKMLSQAENNLLLSLYIKPHLLISRFTLMNFYYNNRNEKGAVYWARELQKFPVKIANPQAFILKDSATRFLRFR